jgi:hypothetical protein
VPGRPADVSFHATAHGFFRMHLELAHVVPVRAEEPPSTINALTR